MKLPFRIGNRPIQGNFDFLLKAQGSLGTSLPTGAEDGQVAYYQAATDVVWQFRFNRATGFWDFVGGSPLTDLDDSTLVTTTSTSPVTLAPLIELTVPLAGDYLVGHGCGQMDNTGAGYAQARSWLGGAGSDVITVWGNSGNGVAPGFIRTRLNGVTAGTLVQQRYNATAATARFLARRLVCLILQERFMIAAETHEE